jgi:hypothetical protein
MRLAPATRLGLATFLRPIALLFVPVALILMIAGAPFWLTAMWLLLNAVLALLTACPRCHQSIFWNEQSRLRTLLAEPHRICTRCGFHFGQT